MEYLATIYIREPGDDAPAPAPGDLPEIGEAWGRFHQVAGPAIRGGEALRPTATATTVRHGDAAAADEPPLVTDGPFTETAEVIGGYYVFETASRDEATTLAAAIPALADPRHAVEVQPLAVAWAPDVTPAARPGDTRYLAISYRPAAAANRPGSAAWQETARRHEQFRHKHGDTLLAGAAVDVGAAATTVRVRDGHAVTADGPARPADHIVTGYYLLRAASPGDALAVAQDIPSVPGGAVELRPVVDFADRDGWE